MALIVVADDEVLLGSLLAELLEDGGHEVLTAAHGAEALALLRQRKPALLITDFMMPVMTGLELASAVRAEPGLADVPIILVSGAQGSIGRRHAHLYAEVLDKPYARQDMLDVVARALSDPSCKAW